MNAPLQCAEEGLGARLARGAERGRWPRFDDPALVHEHDAVGDVHREVHLVGDDEHRHAGGGERSHHVEDPGDELGVERRRRLVEQHQLGVERQRPGDRDALLLTAGQARRVLVGLVGEPDVGQLRPRPRVGRRPAQPSRATQPERDVLDGGEVREHVEVLEHHADLGAQADQPSALGASEPRQPAMLLRRAVLAAVEDDRSGRRRGDEVDAAQQRALARAARSDDAHDLATLDVEVDAVEHLDRAERLGDRAESEERIGHHRPMVVCEQSLVRLGV